MHAALDSGIEVCTCSKGCERVIRRVVDHLWLELNSSNCGATLLESILNPLGIPVGESCSRVAAVIVTWVVGDKIIESFQQSKDRVTELRLTEEYLQSWRRANRRPNSEKWTGFELHLANADLLPADRWISDQSYAVAEVVITWLCTADGNRFLVEAERRASFNLNVCREVFSSKWNSSTHHEKV